PHRHAGHEHLRLRPRAVDERLQHGERHLGASGHPGDRRAVGRDPVRVLVRHGCRPDRLVRVPLHAGRPATARGRPGPRGGPAVPHPGRPDPVGRVRRLRVGGYLGSRCGWVSFAVSAVVAAFGGILYAATSGAAGPTSGLELLLPAFAAAVLGATKIPPGRFNHWGTVIAVYFLVTGITGLQLLGAESYVQNLFYGAALVL